MADTGRRALIATVVGALGAIVGVAGLGHAYLREWRRAIAWFALVIGTMLVLAFLFVDPGGVSTSMSFFEFPSTVVWPIVTLLVLSTLDAYITARRPGAKSTSDEPTCPACGREIDAEIDFCPWCTERFDGEGEAETDDDLRSRVE